MGPSRTAPSLKAILFDCDGTLVDSEVMGCQALVDLAGEYGLVLTVQQALVAFRGHRMASIVAELEERLGRGLPAAFVPRLRMRMEESFRQGLQPIDGARELLTCISAEVSVASNGPVEKTELSLALTGLLPFFEGRIYSGYGVGSWKPDPGLFLHVAAEMGVPPERCAVVEDSLAGVQAGLSAGMRVFAYQPHGIHPDLPDSAVVVEHLLELREHLAG